MNNELVKCKYCGEKFSTRGIFNHEKFCQKNPINLKKNLVTIIPKKSMVIKINGENYRFIKGDEIEVKSEVANILEKYELAVKKESD